MRGRVGTTRTTAGLLFVTGLAAGCTGDRGTADGAVRAAGAGDSLRIGVLHSGPVQPATIPAVRLALDEFNAARGPGMRPLAIVVPRDSEPRSATLARWQRDPAVVGIVSSDGSEATLVAAGIIRAEAAAGRAPTPYITASAGARHVSGLTPWLFRVAPHVDEMAAAQLRFAHDSLGARRVAVAYIADVFGRETLGRTLDLADSLGVRIVTAVAYDAGLHDLPLTARRIHDVAADALLVYSGDVALTAALLRAIRATGDRTPVVTTPALGGLSSWPGEFDGVVYLGDSDSEAIGTSFGRALVARRAGPDRFGPRPFISGYAVRAYDAARLVAGATARVGADRARLRDAIAAGAPARAEVATTRGVRFDARNDADVVLRPFRIAARAEARR